MKTRLLSIFALVSLLCTLFVPAFGQAEEPITLTFAFWGNNDEIPIKEKLAQMYMDAHPNVKIECTFTDGGQYPTKLQTWFASGTAPDVMGIANDILAPFRDEGVFADLAPYMERDGLLEGIWNQRALDVLSDGEGHVYAAPYIYKIPAVVYNKTMLDAAGIAYPASDWTEEEMIDIAKQLTSGSGRSQIYGMNLSGWPYNLYRNLYGQPVYDTQTRTVNAQDNESFKHALGLFAKMVGELKVSPDDVVADAIGGGFETGKFAMAITAPWEMAAFSKTIGDAFEWDVVPLPRSEQYGHWQGNLFADGWTMSASTKHPEEAWDFIKFMTATEEAQAHSAPIGVPMLTSYATSEAYLNDFYGNEPYNKMAFVEMLDYATGWETSGVWGKLNDEIQNQYKLVINGKQDLDTAVVNIQKNCEALLAQ